MELELRIIGLEEENKSLQYTLDTMNEDKNILISHNLAL